MRNYIINYDDYLISPDIMINDVTYNTVIKLIKELKNKYPFVNIDCALIQNTYQNEYRRGSENLVYKTVYHTNECEFKIEYSINNIIENCKITSSKFHDCYKFLELFCELYDNLIKIDSIIRDYCWAIISQYEGIQERSNESLRGINISNLNTEQYNRYTDILFSDNIYKEIAQKIKENKEIYNNIKNTNDRNKEIREKMLILNTANNIKFEQEFSMDTNIKYLYNI